MGRDISPFYKYVIDEIFKKQSLDAVLKHDLNFTSGIIHPEPVSLKREGEIHKMDNPKCLFIWPSGEDAESYYQKFDQLLETAYGIEKEGIFEISGNKGNIVFSFTAGQKDINLIESAVKNFLPNSISQIDSCENVKVENLKAYSFIPTKPFYFSLSDYLNFTISPINSIARLFSKIKNEDIGIYQINFMPLPAVYHDYIKSAVDISWGAMLPTDSKIPPSLSQGTMAKRLEYKSLEFGSCFSVLIKIFVPSYIKDEEVIACMSHYTYGAEKLNCILPNNFSPSQIEGMVNRKENYQNGFVVNSHEFAAFCHVLFELLPKNKTEKNIQTAPAGGVPDRLSKYPGVLLGAWKCGKKRIPVFLPSVFSIGHCHIQGASRCGKSSLLCHMAIDAYRKGMSCIVLDFHGDLVKSISRYVTEDMFKDTTIIDFGRDEIPVLSLKYNFDLHNPSRIADNLTMSMKDSGNSENKWFGPRMLLILYILFYIMSVTDLQMTDLHLLLGRTTEAENLRQKIKAKVNHPIVINFLNDFVKSNTAESTAPVITRLSHLLLDSRSFAFFSTKDHKISIQDILNKPPKLCLVNLSIGELGQHRSSILSGILEGMIINNMLSRSTVPYEKRNEVLLIKDEFQNSPIDPSPIISGAAKYGLNLVLANQHFSQVEHHVRDALSTCGTRLMMKQQQRDADVLDSDFAIPASEFVNISQFHGFLKCDDETVKIETARLSAPKNDLSEKLMKHCIDRDYVTGVKNNAEKKIFTLDQI